jgi:transcription initiation factor TFIIIB Brf1 subunit/transcription initiation factor TFIIB
MSNTEEYRFKLFHILNDKKEDKYNDKDENTTLWCSHPDIIYDKYNMVCSTCGMITENSLNIAQRSITDDSSCYGNNSRVHIRKRKEKSIFKDIKGFNFDKDIINIANDIYNQITNNKIFRGRSRKSIIYACITYAYRMRDITVNTNNILQLFQINKKSGLSGMRYLNMNINDNIYKLSNNRHLSPINIIKNVMKIFNATKEDTNEVIELYKQIKNKSSKINRSRPKSIANSVIYYWIKMNNKNIDISFFSSKVNMSELTINKLVKEIKEIHEKKMY